MWFIVFLLWAVCAYMSYIAQGDAGKVFSILFGGLTVFLVVILLYERRT